MKLKCRECGTFCGFIRNGKPSLPFSCPKYLNGNDCKMQRRLESKVRLPGSESVIGKSKIANGLTPRMCAKYSNRD